MSDARQRGVVLVTGSTGFLGPYVNRALAQAGWTVRAAVRDPHQPVLAHEKVVVGAIDANTDWRAALAGAQAVVHLAGRAHQSADDQAEREAHFRMNAEGSLRLADAAAGLVDRFVHMSTILVHGPTTEGRPPFCEDDPLLPASAYAHSKATAEDGLREISARTGLDVTILRPPLIYGQGAKGNFERLARIVRAGVPLPFKTIGNRRAFAAGENVADLVAHCVRHTGDPIGTLIVADREQVSTGEFTVMIAEALGRRSRLWPLPPALLRRSLETLGKGRLADSLLSSLEVDASKAERSGWAPIVSLPEGLRHSFDDRTRPLDAGALPDPPSR